MTLRRILLALSLACCALFGSTLALSFADPLRIERAARELIRMEVERRVGERVQTLSNSRIGQLAKKSLGQTDAEIDDIQRDIVRGIPARVARIVGDMMKADCACRQRLAANLARAYEDRLATLVQLRERMDSLIEAAYQQVSRQLLREVRIFAAANGAAFALLALVTCFRRGAALQTLLPAVVLVGAVFLTAGLYLFGQDWLHTLIYSDYVGLAYFGYLAAATLLLADIAFNRARLTTRLLNIAAQAIGSTLQLAPC